MSNLPQPPQPGPIAAGQVCDPDNISSSNAATAAAHELVCQLTDVTETVMMPAQFQNALKGDVILAPGGTSTIARMFLALNPVQYHSHSGIMSQNFVEVTHCTAAEGRLADYTQGVASTGGIQPDVLTYLWPGSVTQTIDAAVNGENWLDPAGKSYLIQGFGAEAVGNTDAGQFVLTPPVVVKPDPENAATRTKLQSAAEFARSLGGQIDAKGNVTVKPKAHYRFYCYTKPEIALTETAPASAGWAVGTFPAVCASFIWYCMRKSGIHFDTTGQYVTTSDLPSSAVLHGAVVGPETIDGLFFYSQAERLAGGKVLNAIFEQMVLDAEGFASNFNGNILPNWSSDISDQIINTFAFDNAANGWGSNAWMTPGTGNAVSPDNIEWWKGPPTGVLGYAETLQFLDTHPEQYTVSRWKQVAVYGSITGKVTVDGAPAEKAYVRIYDGKDTYTDASGAYKLDHVAVGSYNITAEMVYKGYEYSVTKKVTLTAADANIKVDLALNPPSKDFRRLDIRYTWIAAEENDGGHHQMSIGPDQQSIPLSPGQVTNSIHIDCDDPGKYNVMYCFTAYLLEDLSMQVSLMVNLYDNDDQSNHEDGCGPYTYNVGLDDTVSIGALNLSYSSTWGGWAAASRLTFTLKNSQDD